MIRLTDDYVIFVNDLEYAVCEDKHKKQVDKDGNERDVYTTIGHFMSLEGAIKFARNWSINRQLSDGTYTLEDALREVRKINAEFTDIMERVLYD